MYEQELCESESNKSQIWACAGAAKEPFLSDKQQNSF